MKTIKTIVLVLVVLWILFGSFILGIVTAFAYPQECYDMFIDKSYPCKILKQ